jgi:hypothetical protein
MRLCVPFHCLLIGLVAGATARAACPDEKALDSFKYQIAYERTEQSRTLKGLSVLHLDVWQRGPQTAFYVREQLKDFAPPQRISYIFDQGENTAGGSCPIEKDWQACVKSFLEGSSDAPAQTCEVVLDARTIPPWTPSSNDVTKRRVVSELRSEIERFWPGTTKVVIRDFNLRDNQITMELTTAEGRHYQGCGFSATKNPHCSGWHLFGQAPLSEIRAGSTSVRTA